MTIAQIKKGRELSKLLEEKSNLFNVKSDQHTILLHESSILNANLDKIEQGNKNELLKSELLGTWGDARCSEEWNEFKSLVATFYQAIEQDM